MNYFRKQSTIVKNDNLKQNLSLNELSPSLIVPNRYKELLYRRHVFEVAKTQKFFTIYNINDSLIRKCLIERGWIEKCLPNYLSDVQKMPFNTLLKLASPGNDYETVLLSELSKQYPVKFIQKNNNLQNQISINGAYQNFIKHSGKVNFTSKEGLFSCVENAHWNIIDGVSDIQVPRFHRLAYPEEHLEFLRDYRFTFCLSFLKIIQKENVQLFHEFGAVPTNVIDFAIQTIINEINNHKYMDFESDEILDNEKWNIFFRNSNFIIDHVKKMKIKYYCDIYIWIKKCKSILKLANDYYPNRKSDGTKNLWILKPGYLSRGNGIVIKSNYNDIIQFCKKRYKMRYIVQKYIENPLLIYKTKFDIRQFMLVAITNSHYNIWMYKECYLRFSSEEYQLDDLKESIHITNNAVQKKYYNNGKRRNKHQIPSHNMWSLQQFQSYLKENGKENIWSNKIYLAMKKNIIGILMSSLEETEFMENSFQLFGCDFILDKNYEILLLEINSNPDMSPTTAVTKKICPKVQSDIFKVVLDVPKNPFADTGNFELIYSVDYFTKSMDMWSLKINGNRLKTLKNFENSSNA